MGSGSVIHKLAEGAGGIINTLDAKRAGEVVAATTGDDEERNFEFDQLREVPVDGSIAAKEDCKISLFKQRGP